MPLFQSDTRTEEIMQGCSRGYSTLLGVLDMLIQMLLGIQQGVCYCVTGLKEHTSLEHKVPQSLRCLS